VQPKRALVCSYYLPQPDLDSSSRRLHHLVGFLLDDGWEVTAAARNPGRSGQAARALGELGVPAYAPIGPELHRLIVAEPFDVAILGFWHIAELLMNEIRRSSPRTRVIVDSMDIHFLRHARSVFAPSVQERPVDALDDGYASELVRELNAYAAADAVLAVSEKEAGLVGDFIADPHVAHAVPDCENLSRSPLGFEDRKGMLFVGNFEHPPNLDAVNFLCEEVLPLLDRDLMSEHPLTIVGNDAHLLIGKRGLDDPNVRLVGWVPSVVPYLEQTRISVIPLRYGAGTKRKLIQTLMVGTPAVSTSLGVEGLDLRDGDHVLVADDAPAFADAVARLLGHRAQWEALAAKGRQHVVDRRGLETSRRSFLSAIAAASARPPKQRLLAVPDWTSEQEKVAPVLYDGIVRRIQRLVRQLVPPSATLLVVSRGDPDLVDLDARDAWHFPRDERTGRYAGFHPVDSSAAIEHLEALREEGGEFLLLPSTSFWWLETYDEFAAYLVERYARLADDSACLIFDLRSPGATSQHDGDVREPRAQPAVVSRRREPLVSVVIPTHNRAALLEASLSSLAEQSLARDSFEVVVVDDGSTDATPLVCDDFSRRLALRYVAVDRAGIGAAKNAGAQAATGSIVFFFDDDDVADPDLLLNHTRAHDDHADEEVAVLGYTGWARSLAVTEVMRFVTDIGHYLFSYDGLDEGQELDFTYFWGGRTSCKRSFLTKRGLFRSEFMFGSEDIELAYRLSKVGLRVVYWPRAVQYMNRPITYDEFCSRCERQGASQWIFSQMHEDPEVQDWCGVADARKRWEEVEPMLDERRRRAEELEQLLAGLGGTREQEDTRQQLWELYWWTFEACKLKGMAEAQQLDRPTPRSTAAPVTARG
jgi:GT2 family glycosyltransferase/glycosyltransferase involved in cell wall biosynthesis